MSTMTNFIGKGLLCLKFRSRVGTGILLLAVMFCTNPDILNAQTNYTIGTGTGYNGTTTYPAPYGNYYWGARQQYLVRASELIDAGADAGYITQLGFDVYSAVGEPLNGFTIKIKNTSVSSLGSTWDNVGFTTVFGPQKYTESSGWNMHRFNEVFEWDGSSNLLVEICFNNNGYTYNAQTRWTSYSYNASMTYRADNADNCGTSNSPNGGNETWRPNMRFTIMEKVANDAGILSFSSPADPFASGNRTVTARLVNWGNNTLSSVKIEWSVNGSDKTPINWNGSLAPGQTSYVELGMVNFPEGSVTTVEAATANPNSTNDGNPNNDSYSHGFVPALGGTYTIGPDGDFSDFNDAVDALNDFGVGGPVIFNVQAGTYVENISIGSIEGTGPGRTVTFQSTGGNAADVHLQWGGTNTTNNYLVLLSGTAYVQFKNLTFNASGGSSTSYGRIFELQGSVSGFHVEGCVLNGKDYNTTSTYMALVYAYLVNGDGYTFKDNEFNNGSYAIYMRGSSSVDLANNVAIQDNVFNNFYYMAGYNYYVNSLNILNNTYTTDRTYTSVRYIYAVTCYGDFNIVGNNAYGAQAGYGIYMSSIYPATRGLVANNMIQIGASTVSSTCYGLYLSSCNTLDILHNSVSIEGTSTSGRPVYVSSGSGLAIDNNIFANFGQGYSWYTFTSSGVESADNNVLYNMVSSRFAYHSGAQTSLAALQSSSGWHANSINVDPNFVSGTDLHAGNPAMNGLGRSTDGLVPTDIEGNVRNAYAPDPGADEFTPAGLDAKIVFISPVKPAPAGLNNVVVNISNLRTTPISSVELQYSDGNNIVTQVFSGSPHFPIQAEAGADLTFDTPINFQGPLTISANILKVNGTPGDDELANNSTGEIGIAPALSGAYTVGSSGADFPTISAALQALNDGGITGNVWFNISPGTYYEQLSLWPFVSANPNHTVTIQAANGERSSVVIIPASTSSTDNHTVRFEEGAANYILNRLTIEAVDAGSYGYVIEFADGSNNLVIQNSRIDAKEFSTSSNFRAFATESSSIFLKDITIENNEINGGYYAFYLYGPSSNKSRNVNILNNTITNFRVYGIYSYYNQEFHIAGNDFSRPTRTSLSTMYAIYMYQNANHVIEGNSFHRISPSGGSYTSYTVYCSASDSPDGEEIVLRNNLFYDLNTYSTLYAVYNSSSNGFHVYNNTFALDDDYTSSGSTTTAFYQSSTATNVKFFNNIVSITRGGSGDKYGVYYGTTSSDIYSENNLIYVNGAGGNNYIGNYGGSLYTTLPSWQAASGKDASSVNANPQFMGAGDYRIAHNSLAARSLAMPVPGLTVDIQGKLRSMNYPDAGAYISPPTVFITGNANFGKVGQPVTVELAMNNTSAADPIAALDAGFTGSGAGSFTITEFSTNRKQQGEIQTTSLAPNASKTAQVGFGILGYSAPGQQNAFINITGSAANAPYSYPVSGYFASLTAQDEGTNLLAVNAKLDVGGVLVGGTPVTKSFVLSPDAGTLDAPIRILGYRISGPDAGLFRVSTIPEEIGSDLNVGVTLSSQGAGPGTKEATLTIDHTGANGPSIVIEITGKVGKPVLGAPSLVDLPFVVTGQSYADKFDNVALIPLERAGLVDVELYANPHITGSGAGQMEIITHGGGYFIRGRYSITGDVVPDGNIQQTGLWRSASSVNPVKVTNTQPYLIAVRMRLPGASTPVGAYNADIQFANGTGKGASNAENFVQTTLLGEVVSDPARLPLFPQQLAFGSVAIGASSEKTLIVRNQSGNAGDVTLTINGEYFRFDNGQKSQTLALGAGNEPVYVTLRFAPGSAGPSNAGITASGVINASIPVSGTGLAADAGQVVYLVDGVAIENMVDFGNVVVGQIGRRTVTVLNNSVAPIEIGFISRSGANATQFTVDADLPLQVAQNGGTAEFTLNFIPTSLSNPEKSATITVFNSTGIPRVFSLHGNAVSSAGTVVDVTITPESYNFGSTDGWYDFTVTNDGNAGVSIDNALILGSQNFSIDPNESFPRTVAGGGASSTIRVWFDAAVGTNGSRSGTLLINVPGLTPYPVAALSGTVSAAYGGQENQTEGITGIDSRAPLYLEGNYPNPLVRQTEVRYRLEQAVAALEIRVYTAAGVELLKLKQGSQSAGTYSVQLDAEGLAAGTYYYVVEADGKRRSAAFTVIK